MKKSRIVSKKKVLVGLDPSLRGTGCVVLQSESKDVLQTELISTSSTDCIEYRIDTIWKELVSRVFYPYKTEIEHVGLESLAFGAKGQRRDQLAGLHYRIRVGLFTGFPRIPVVLVSPSSLQKFVTGKGRVKKNMMMLSCYKKFGFEPSDDNICDAYCLARFILEGQTK